MTTHTFDPTRYLHHMEDTTMSRAEKIAMIEALWLVAQSFSDHAFGHKPSLAIGGSFARKTRKEGSQTAMLQTKKFAPSVSMSNYETSPHEQELEHP